MDLRTISQIFQAGAAVAALAIVPHTLFALLRHERNEKVRYAREHPTAYYHPSLNYLTWLNWAFMLAILYLVANFALRVYLKIESPDALAEQPQWSYAISMFGTLFLLVVFVLPSTFLIVVKQRIVRDPIIDVADSLAKDTNKMVREIQQRGQADQPAKRKDRSEGHEHRYPTVD